MMSCDVTSQWAGGEGAEVVRGRRLYDVMGCDVVRTVGCDVTAPSGVAVVSICDVIGRRGDSMTSLRCNGE